ncbi:MAG: hypothetical protein NC041_08540 [Bacteroides sp.]|nr:hypothetical protein [Prevotella sp.]MCM1408269.1 hypothetical protein [Treponema brennaborense]MCM1470499.1 hypothetical protein [Bacteroides sp.]
MIRFFKRRHTMRGRKNFSAAAGGAFVLGALLPLACFCSCSQDEDIFNASVRGFFERSTHSVAVVKHELCAESYGGPEAGIDYISGDADALVKLYLRNPQRLQFTAQENMNFSFAVESAADAAVSVVQDETDFSVLLLTYPRAFLVSRESQDKKDISVDITLQYEDSAVPIEPYRIDLRCDTKPPQVYAVGCADRGSDAVAAALLFALPPKSDLASVHRDIASLSIGGTQYEVAIAADGTPSFTPSDETAPAVQPYNADSLPSAFASIKSQFKPSAGWQPFCLITENASAADAASCVIALTDAAGFSSETTVRFEDAVKYTVEIAGFSNFTFTANAGGGTFTVNAAAADGTAATDKFDWMLRVFLDGADISDRITDAGGSINGNTIQFPSSWKGDEIYRSLTYRIAVTADYDGFADGVTLEYTGAELGL